MMKGVRVHAISNQQPRVPDRLKMRPSVFFRALSLQFPARTSPSTVAPFPVQTSFDKLLTPWLNTLQCHSNVHDKSYACASWLVDAIEIAVATQKATFESLRKISIFECDRNLIEDYLNDDVILLDACNSLRDRIDTLNKYIESLRIVVHCLEGGSFDNSSTLTRACNALESCNAMERKSAELDNCSSSLRKMGERLAQSQDASRFEGHNCNTQLHEVLNGAKAVALFACGVLGIALSSKTKRGLPAVATQFSRATAWSCSLHELHKQVKENFEKRRKSGSAVLVELRDTVNATKTLRDQINLRKGTCQKVNVEELRRNIMQLESIKPLDARVSELYRNLVSTRLALLGVLTAA